MSAPIVYIACAIGGVSAVGIAGIGLAGFRLRDVTSRDRRFRKLAIMVQSCGAGFLLACVGATGALGSSVWIRLAVAGVGLGLGLSPLVTKKGTKWVGIQPSTRKKIWLASSITSQVVMSLSLAFLLLQIGKLGAIEKVIKWVGGGDSVWGAVYSIGFYAGLLIGTGAAVGTRFTEAKQAVSDAMEFPSGKRAT